MKKKKKKKKKKKRGGKKKKKKKKDNCRKESILALAPFVLSPINISIMIITRCI